MENIIEYVSELTKTLTAFNAEIEVVKKEIKDFKTLHQDVDILLDVKGVMAKTGWSLKTAQKAMQDERMHTIWVSKGPQVTLRELERYCSLNIDRTTDPYWTNN